MQTKPNVLLITVDALAYKRLGFAGHSPSPSPTIDRLMAEGLTFTQAMTPGSPTQMAMTAVHSSTLPLDDGGYAHGVRDRGATLAEAFSGAGYRTASFHGAHVLNAISGYARGFDDFHTLTSPAGRVVHYGFNVARDFYRARYEKGEVSLEYCMEIFIPYLRDRFLPHLRELCAQRAAEIAEGAPLSPVIHNWDFDLLPDVVALEEEWLRRDPRGYMLRLFSEGLRLGERMATLWRENAPPVPMEFLEKAHVALRAPFKVRTNHASGRYIADRFVRWLDTARGGDAPFFANLHLMDVHDHNAFSYDVAENQGPLLAQEWEAARTLSQRIWKEDRPDQGWSFYSVAVQYLDTQLRRILDALKARGLRGKTIVVLCADHGSGYGLPAERTFNWLSQHEENLHVPMVFHGPGVPRRVDDGLCSLLDLPVTTLELAGVEVPASFRGRSLLRRAEPRPYVQMETLGSGWCDFNLKPMYLGVRSATHKVTCEIPPPGQGDEGRLIGLYDLRADPYEIDNRAGAPFPEELTWMLDVVSARALEVRAQLGLGAAAERAAEPAEAGLELESVAATP